MWFLLTGVVLTLLVQRWGTRPRRVAPSPPETERPERPERPEPSPAAPSGLVVLIVEDNKLILEMVGRDIEALPAQVHLALNLCEAHAILERVTPQAAIVDLGLPDGSGLDIIRTLRSNSATRTIPIIIISGIPELRGPEILLTSGADRFFTKPFPDGEPLTSLREALRLRSN